MKRSYLLPMSICLVVACSVFASSSAHAKLKIGVVNMQRAIAESKDGKKAQKQLVSLKKKLEAELNRKLKEFYEKEKGLRKAWSVLPDDAKRQKAQKSAKRYEALRKEYLVAERQLMQRRTKVMLRIGRKINKIIERIAKGERYDYIFSNAALLFVRERHVNLTNQVIRLYNK